MAKARPSSSHYVESLERVSQEITQLKDEMKIIDICIIPRLCIYLGGLAPMDTRGREH